MTSRIAAHTPLWHTIRVNEHLHEENDWSLLLLMLLSVKLGHILERGFELNSSGVVDSLDPYLHFK